MFRWFFIVGIVTFACACASTPSAPEGPNLILISLDTVRADHTTPYGYTRDTTPHLNRLAQEGIVYEQVMSPSPWTLPAHVSMLTGQYPLRHGVHHKDHTLATGIPTLATHFKSNGLRTGAITNSGYLKHRSGLHRDFDAYRTIQEYEHSPTPTPAWTTAKDWLTSHKEERFFLFVHIYDAHSAYVSEPPSKGLFADAHYAGPVTGSTQQLLEVRRGTLSLHEEDWSHLRNVYDENLHQTDAALGALLAHIQDLGLRDNTVIAVTSDHGEALGEHGGEVLHGRTHFEELLHVPWILAGPGITSARHPQPVSLVDVAPTLAEHLGLPLPFTTDGVSRLGAYNSTPLFAEADQNGAMHHALRTVRINSWKMTRSMADGSTRFVNLETDPNETHPITDMKSVPQTQLNAALEAHISGIVPAIAPTVPHTTEEQELLESLGYLDPPAPKR